VLRAMAPIHSYVIVTLRDHVLQRRVQAGVVVGGNVVLEAAVQD
jgi:hypothetical protein